MSYRWRWLGDGDLVIMQIFRCRKRTRTVYVSSLPSSCTSLPQRKACPTTGLGRRIVSSLILESFQRFAVSKTMICSNHHWKKIKINTMVMTSILWVCPIQWYTFFQDSPGIFCSIEIYSYYGTSKSIPFYFKWSWMLSRLQISSWKICFEFWV